ncbi:MAG: glycoside hydrolase family 127 protein, partial [Clostridia bacterium]|nr:glycoside hydrolase family 127 protein [Clostridia bacterium]
AAAELEASFETLFTCPEGVQFADQWEQVFYNVIQSAFSRDLLAVQSIQQANQFSLLPGIRFPFSRPDAALYTIRDPEALTAILPVIPRFLMHQWMLTRDEGLCAMGYAPCQVHYPIKDAQVRITVESDYPVSGQVRITLNMNRDSAFPLRLRLPEWTTHPTALLQGETIEAGKSPFLVLTRQWHDGDVILLNLPMNPRMERGYHQAVSVFRGPLLFSLDLTPDAPDMSDSLTGSTDFAYAIVADEPVRVQVNEDMTEVRLEVTTVSAGIWQTTEGTIDPPPMDIPEARPKDTRNLILVPYAETLLRVSVFPGYSFVR